MLTEEPRQLEFAIPDTGADGRKTDNFHRVNCLQWGNSDAAETVLCVHGLTRNGRDFDFLARALSPEFHVLCPDMPGRGKSQWLPDPQGYNNAAYIDDILYMLDSLKLTQLHWVGTSMGGILGMIAANKRPGLITSLLLNDIGCLIPASGLQRIADIADFQTRFASYAEAEAAFRSRTATFGIRDEAIWRHLLTHGIEKDGDGFRFTYDPGIFRTSAFSKHAPVADVSLWPFWEAVIPIPVLLVRGEASDILLHSTAIEMRSKHPDLTLQEIAGAGHAPTLMEDKQIAPIHEWMSAHKKKKETM
jgi:pimeloyl-ACP methyl ester carboxylesterase